MAEKNINELTENITNFFKQIQDARGVWWNNFVPTEICDVGFFSVYPIGLINKIQSSFLTVGLTLNVPVKSANLILSNKTITIPKIIEFFNSQKFNLIFSNYYNDSNSSEINFCMFVKPNSAVIVYYRGGWQICITSFDNKIIETVKKAFDE